MVERFASMTDPELETALVALGRSIEYPRPTGDLATRVRQRLSAEPGTYAGPAAWWRRLIGREDTARPPAVVRPLRPALVLAIVLLLAAAAVAIAIALGVPGIRIIFAPSGSAQSPTVPAPPTSSASPSGSSTRLLGLPLGLGLPISLDEAKARVGFAPRLPAGIGEPVESYVEQERLTLLWTPTTRLPKIPDTAVGLLVTEFRGQVDRTYYEKVLGGGTTVEAVTVGGNRGYWLSGEPHQLFYVGPSGEPEFETRRVVGQVLIWYDGELTYRLETALSRNDAIQLAESMR